MSTRGLQAVRGMNDILPDESVYWEHVEAICRQVAAQYGYQEIRFPIVESTQLFLRSIGEVTDIVEKEMYTFQDRNGDSLTLRPEGTAGCVRAGIEHGLFYNQLQRLWYLGPMFRHERPQKGRYRQFHQFGIEAYGFAGPEIDAEHLLFVARLWEKLGLSQYVRLELNSLGSQEARMHYRDVLVNYFSAHKELLDEDSQRRLHTNPLRILDSKNPTMASLIQNAPSLLDYLDETSLRHFESLKCLLDHAGVSYVINPRLVRGLDYYCQTVYEWTTQYLGAQGTVCAGGRYDQLIADLGGKTTPAIGFAMGLERIVLLCKELQQRVRDIDIYCMSMDSSLVPEMIVLAEKLRTIFPKMSVEAHLSGGGVKAQFRRADRQRAHWVILLAPEEWAKGQVVIKNMRDGGDQVTLTVDELSQFSF